MGNGAVATLLGPVGVLGAIALPVGVAAVLAVLASEGVTFAFLAVALTSLALLQIRFTRLAAPLLAVSIALALRASPCRISGLPLVGRAAAAVPSSAPWPSSWAAPPFAASWP